MKILTIGDVVGDSGTAAVCERLGEIKEKYAADFCAAVLFLTTFVRFQ